MDRFQVSTHLRWLRKALKKSARGLSLDLGWAENDWFQFESPKGNRTITIDKAIQLKDDHGVSLDWLYLGERFSQLPADIQGKIREVRDQEAAEVARAQAPRRAKSEA